MELANNHGLGFNRDLMLVSFVNNFDFKGQMELSLQNQRS
jgi:hypothetical protein